MRHTLIRGSFPLILHDPPDSLTFSRLFFETYSYYTLRSAMSLPRPPSSASSSGSFSVTEQVSKAACTQLKDNRHSSIPLTYRQEAKELTAALEKKEFREALFQYMQEISDPANRAEQEASATETAEFSTSALTPIACCVGLPPTTRIGG